MVNEIGRFIFKYFNKQNWNWKKNGIEKLNFNNKESLRENLIYNEERERELQFEIKVFLFFYLISYYYFFFC